MGFRVFPLFGIVGFLAVGCVDMPRSGVGLPKITKNPASGGPPNATLSAVSPVSSITHHGITWNFSQSVQAGQYANGDWFVVGPVTLTGISPPTSTIQSQGISRPPESPAETIFTRTRQINGSMLNPEVVDAPRLGGGLNKQGFDQCLAELSALSPCGSNWDPSLNFAQGLSVQAPKTITPTLSQPIFSLVSTRSRTAGFYNEWDPSTLSFSQLQAAAVLTIVKDIPVQGSFRPPYTGVAKGPLFDESMLDYTKLRNVNIVGNPGSVDTVLAGIERVWLDNYSGWPSRYIHPVENMPDYGRNFTSLIGKAMLLTQTNLPAHIKRELVVRIVQIGIDMSANILNAARWESVGGHSSGRLFPVLYAGYLLNHADMKAVTTQFPTVMVVPNSLNPPNRAQFGELASTFYVAQTSSGVFNWGYGNYASTDVGMPEWGNGHLHQTLLDSRVWSVDSGPVAYRRCCTANAWVGQTLVARMMGMQAAVQHPAYFDYMDRYLSIETSGWTRSWDLWQAEMWDAYRANY